jgi:hypothetical protein
MDRLVSTEMIYGTEEGVVYIETSPEATLSREAAAHAAHILVRAGRSGAIMRQIRTHPSKYRRFPGNCVLSGA